MTTIFLFGGLFLVFGFFSKDPYDSGRSDWHPTSPASAEYKAWKYAKKHTKKDRLPPPPPLNREKEQARKNIPEPCGPCGFGC